MRQEGAVRRGALTFPVRENLLQQQQRDLQQKPSRILGPLLTHRRHYLIAWKEEPTGRPQAGSRVAAGGLAKRILSIFFSPVESPGSLLKRAKLPVRPTKWVRTGEATGFLMDAPLGSGGSQGPGTGRREPLTFAAPQLGTMNDDRSPT